MAKYNTVKNNQITAPGGTSTIDINGGESLYYYFSSGTVVMTADYEVVPGVGTITSGTEINILYKGNTNLTTDTSTGKSIIFFGVELSDDQAKTDLEITAIYDTWQNPSSPAWRVSIKPNFDYSKYPPIVESNIKDSSISTSKLKDKAVTLTKTDDLAEGNTYIGNSSNRPIVFSLKDDAKFPLGNGTTSVMRAMSGHVTMSNLGVTTIQPSVITESMLNFTLGDTLLLETELNASQIQNLNDVSITLVSAQGANTLIVPIEAWGFLDYGSATYASGGAVHIKIGSVSLGNVAATTITSASDLVTKFVLTTAVASGSVLNQPLVISCETANFTTGDGVFKLKILYKVLNFS